MLERTYFESLDASDPLGLFRDDFVIPEGVVYLDGNSLGALPIRSSERVREVIENEWGISLISSWNTHDWIHYPRKLGDLIAPIIGAGVGEVVVGDSTSVNLFKLLASALQFQEGKHVIVSEKSNFPTDIYVAQGLVSLLGAHQVQLVDSCELVDALDDDVAVVLLTHVNFRTGEVHDMKKITSIAHSKGALVLWDLSHSAGAFPIDLRDIDCDLAVGCGYKFLNGGPGAPSYIYVAERLQSVLNPSLSGWMGHVAPFEFDSKYHPASGIERHLCGTPSVIAMAALEVGLEIVGRADLSIVQEKSQQMGDLFIQVVEQQCEGLGLSLASPRDSSRRGSQVSFHHEEGYAVIQALMAKGVIGDFRKPDIMRFGLAPLYLRYTDIWDAVDALRDVLRSETYCRTKFREQKLVT